MLRAVRSAFETRESFGAVGKLSTTVIAWVIGILFLTSACTVEVKSDAPPPTATPAAPDLVLDDGCPSLIQRIDAKTIWFCGSMVNDAPAKLAAAIADGDDTLVVTSTGGRPIQAIQIARIVQQKRLRLVVRRICASGCAHFVFMAADAVDVEDGAFIGFHRTNSLIFEIRSSLRDDAVEQLLAGRTAELAFYGDLGIDEKFLLAPGLQVDPVCVSPSINGVSSHQIGSRFRFSVPTRDIINRFRKTPFDGFWLADDLGRAPRIVQLTSGSVFKVTYDLDVYALDRSALMDRIETVRFC